MKDSRVEQWLDRARADLRVAGEILRPDWDYIAVVLFLTQQSAEKFLKALLDYRDIGFPRTHDLRLPGELLQDPTLEELIISVEEYSDFAVVFRYPGDFEEPEVEEAQTALATVRQLAQAVLARIPSELHPTP
jgi:HEPN domain-containing protein